MDWRWRVLLFFQFLRRIGPGGLEGLPEDGKKSDHRGDEDGHDEHPTVTGNPVGVLLQKPGGQPD